MDRSRIVNILLGVSFLFLGVAIFNLQIIQGKNLKSLSDKNCIRLIQQEGSRGKIFDRDGTLIVGNALCYDVTVMPQPSAQLEKIFAELAGVLGIERQDLRSVYKNNYFAPFMPVVVRKNIDVKAAMSVEEMRFALGGVAVSARPIRYYPYGQLAAHIIGYLSLIDRWRLTRLADYGYKTKDVVGFGGVEEKYDYYLRQEPGAQSVNVDHKGRFVRLLGFRPPRSGKDIYLTLDVKIQKIVEVALEGKSGSVIIMNPSSGEILAMANEPTFNPSVFVKKSSGGIEELFSDSDAPLLNRAISGLYPPASVFKVVVAAAGLEAEKVNSSTTFFCPGHMKIGNRVFNCWGVHHQQNMRQAITHSCDIFFYRTGLLSGAQGIHDMAAKFSLAHPTGIDLPYEAEGFVPNPLWKKIYRFQSWYDGDTANLSIGQGDVLVTPLQLTRIMAACANGGWLVKPYIVKAVDNKDISRSQKRTMRLSVRQEVLDQINRGLRSVIAESSGTANALSFLPLAISGKTGTAQVSHGQSHAWFVGYFPSDKPAYVICVFLEHGAGGSVAVQAAKYILEEMLKEGLL